MNTPCPCTTGVLNFTQKMAVMPTTATSPPAIRMYRMAEKREEKVRKAGVTGMQPVRLALWVCVLLH